MKQLIGTRRATSRRAFAAALISGISALVGSLALVPPVAATPVSPTVTAISPHAGATTGGTGAGDTGGGYTGGDDNGGYTGGGGFG